MPEFASEAHAWASGVFFSRLLATGMDVVNVDTAAGNHTPMTIWTDDLGREWVVLIQPKVA